MGQFETGQAPPGGTGVITEARARSLANLAPRWKPGESGNPSGRTKRVDEVEQAIAEAASPERIRKLLGSLYRRAMKGGTRSAGLFLKYGLRGMDEAAIAREVERQLVALMAEAQRARAERAAALEPSR